MKKKINKFVYWTPRFLSIFFILFLILMSFDVFEEDVGLWESILALLIHNIPAIILLIVLIISWRYEIVGGITFILAGLIYMLLTLITAIKNGFEWYYLAWIIQISGIAFLIGIMFLIGWNKKKRKK